MAKNVEPVSQFMDFSFFCESIGKPLEGHCFSKILWMLFEKNPRRMVARSV